MGLSQTEPVQKPYSFVSQQVLTFGVPYLQMASAFPSHPGKNNLGVCFFHHPHPIYDFHFLNSSWTHPVSNSWTTLFVSSDVVSSTFDPAHQVCFFTKANLIWLKFFKKGSLQFSGEKIKFHSYGSKALLDLTAHLGTYNKRTQNVLWSRASFSTFVQDFALSHLLTHLNSPHLFSSILSLSISIASSSLAHKFAFSPS